MTTYALPPTPAGVDEEAWRTAISAIRGYCEWHIAPVVTETIKVDGTGGGLLLLPTRRLLSVTDVTNKGVAVADSDLSWSSRGSVRAGSVCWSMDGYEAVTLTIQHGYEDFPPEVLAVARNMAAAGWGSVGGKLTSGPHSVEISGAGQVGAAATSAAHERILKRFRVGPGL